MEGSPDLSRSQMRLWGCVGIAKLTSISCRMEGSPDLSGLETQLGHVPRLQKPVTQKDSATVIVKKAQSDCIVSMTRARVRGKGRGGWTGREGRGGQVEEVLSTERLRRGGEVGE